MLRLPLSEDHRNFWKTQMRIIEQFPTSTLAFLHGSGPFDWPRGRVLFNTAVKRFEVYLDDQLLTSWFEAAILGHFHLPKTETSFALDSRYTGPRFVLGPQGPLERAS